MPGTRPCPVRPRRMVASLGLTASGRVPVPGVEPCPRDAARRVQAVGVSPTAMSECQARGRVRTSRVPGTTDSGRRCCEPWPGARHSGRVLRAAATIVASPLREPRAHYVEPTSLRKGACVRLRTSPVRAPAAHPPGLQVHARRGARGAAATSGFVPRRPRETYGDRSRTAGAARSVAARQRDSRDARPVAAAETAQTTRGRSGVARKPRPVAMPSEPRRPVASAAGGVVGARPATVLERSSTNRGGGEYRPRCESMPCRATSCGARSSDSTSSSTGRRHRLARFEGARRADALRTSADRLVVRAQFGPDLQAQSLRRPLQPAASPSVRLRSARSQPSQYGGRLRRVGGRVRRDAIRVRGAAGQVRLPASAATWLDAAGRSVSRLRPRRVGDVRPRSGERPSSSSWPASSLELDSLRRRTVTVGLEGLRRAREDRARRRTPRTAARRARIWCSPPGQRAAKRHSIGSTPRRPSSAASALVSSSSRPARPVPRSTTCESTSRSA